MPVEVRRPPGFQLAAEGDAAVLGDDGGLLGIQRMGSYTGRPAVQQGRGVFPQHTLPFRALSRLTSDFQQRLGVPPQAVGHGLRQSQSATRLVPEDNGAMHLAAAPVPHHLDVLVGDAVAGGMPVVLASRSSAGRVVMTPRKDEQGFIVSDNLMPQKARLLLMLGLTITNDRDALQQMFYEY